MRAGRLHNARGADRLLDCALNGRCVNVMAADAIARRVFGARGCRKHILPAPFVSGARVFARQGELQLDLAKARRAIGVMQHTGARKLALERADLGSTGKSVRRDRSPAGNGGAT